MLGDNVGGDKVVDVNARGLKGGAQREVDGNKSTTQRKGPWCKLCRRSHCARILQTRWD